ncbi:RRQRL motif-containing zinc-binding protein [Nocardia sp. NPDC127579]|uniref:RRQRL motif-containing zinc-binding protein n=1 Tax=Nocardia sp. NPDC127579 TaxID=3345402 RepID=UPI0036285028
MSAHTEPGGIPTYPWRCAPTHLRTRRQLAAEGLRPNGQDIAGVVPLPRGAGVAYLYDITQAAPKREPSAAQLEALARATREHQLRAAERRGVDRAELAQIGDPGPAWAEPTSQVSALAGLGGNAFAAQQEQEGFDR